MLRLVVLLVWGLGWASGVQAQAPAKTWKTLDELSAQERAGHIVFAVESQPAVAPPTKGAG